MHPLAYADCNEDQASAHKDPLQPRERNVSIERFVDPGIDFEMRAFGRKPTIDAIDAQDCADNCDEEPAFDAEAGVEPERTPTNAIRNHRFTSRATRTT